jgi:hypothetical protein
MAETCCFSYIRNKQKSLGARSGKLKGRYTISDEVPLGNQNFVPIQHTSVIFFLSVSAFISAEVFVNSQLNLNQENDLYLIHYKCA